MVNSMCFSLSTISKFVFERSILGEYKNFIPANVSELKFTKKTTKEKEVSMPPNEEIFLSSFMHHKFTF